MLIVGLGNPGVEYKNTHHNVGFMALDILKDFYHFEFKKSSRYNAEIAEIKIGKEKIIFLKPLTFMNNSGESVGKVARHYKINPSNILIIHDDMDLPLAKIRIRKCGSSGGHNGLKSIIAHLGSQDFNRIRFGIDHGGYNHEGVIDYVLSPFTKKEHEIIDPVMDKIPSIIDDCIKNGIDYIMNHYN